MADTLLPVKNAVGTTVSLLTQDNTTSLTPYHKEDATQRAALLDALPALGTAGSPALDVVTIQGATGGTALPVSVATIPTHAVTQSGSWTATVSVTDLGTGDYETVAASATEQILGATGAVGDYLAGLLIIPASTSPGAVSVKDGNGSAITLFAGGASSLGTLIPFFVPLSAKAVNGTTPGWKVTTGTNVSVVATGNFT